MARGCKLSSGGSCMGGAAPPPYAGTGSGAKAGGGAEETTPLRRTQEDSRLIVGSGEDEFRGDALPGMPEPGTGVARDTDGSGGDSSVAAKLGCAGGAAAAGGTGICSAVLGVARVDGPEPGGSALRLAVMCGVVVARLLRRESNISAEGWRRLLRLWTCAGGRLGGGGGIGGSDIVLTAIAALLLDGAPPSARVW